MTDTAPMRVLYNADCPVCRAEIDHYAAHAAARDLPIRFDDLNGPDITLWGIAPDAAARRLHVLHEGRVVAGVEAFRLLWDAMPRYRWLARVTGLPGVRQAAGLLYERVAAPILYRAHLRRVARAVAARSAGG
jgi:predicted DCC family thiol-disulfide oxidoreductase YuxK